MKLVSLESVRKTVAENVPEDNLLYLYNIFVQMEELCDGVGLAGVQVGLPMKLFIAKDVEKFRFFLNCGYIGEGDKADSVESCLTLEKEHGFPVYYQVSRYKKIKFFGKELLSDEKLMLSEINTEVDGFFAVVLQHEIDHQFGVLILDVGAPVSLWR